MPKRTFQLSSPDDFDAVEFELVYKLTEADGAKQEKVETFACQGALPAQAARYLTMESSALASIGFIERCILTNESALRFLELTVDRAVLIRREDLADVVEWLTETYSGHPTRTPAP